MSESLDSDSKQLHPQGRRSYRKSNSFSTMGSRSRKGKNNSTSSHSNTSLNDVDGSSDNNSINTTGDFNSNGITTASTPFTQNSKSPIYPTEELARMSNDHLTKSWSTHSKEQEKIKEEDTSNSIFYDIITNKIIWMAIVVLLVGLIPIYTRIQDTLKSNVNIKVLKEKFPDQPNETWLYFETIIDDILIINPTHPAVFLLLYTTENNKVNNLIHHLARYASTKLETNEDYIYVNKEEFHSDAAIEDYGFLINKYEQDLIKKKVMIVEDLQEIPGNVAQAFHSLCDEITPLVDKVVYIFTLKVDSLNGKGETIAETYLKKFWSDLDEDILMPLVTRVTSTVIKIVNQP